MKEETFVMLGTLKNGRIKRGSNSKRMNLNEFSLLIAPERNNTPLMTRVLPWYKRLFVKEDYLFDLWENGFKRGCDVGEYAQHLHTMLVIEDEAEKK